MSDLQTFDPARVRFDAAGLVPVIVQDASGVVLMLAYMNRETLGESIELGETVFFSRSRGQRWHKGATSGNRQRILSLSLDCDGDTILARVDALGPACHTGARTCFESGEAK
jgi:phosphoribosyl-AMP cyclohydrolase